GEKGGLVRAGLRELDRDVLDIEHSLTALGHDEAAEALVRAETLRERGRGLRALLAEKQRGLERELTAAADEGVIETLVADAAALRRERAEGDDESSALEPKLADVEAAEQELAAERAELDGGERDLADGVPAAEAHLAAADERWREAEADAARRRARVEALELALSEARAGAGAEALADVDGVAGPLADDLESENGMETAVAVGLGDALQAVVLEGGAAARRAFDRVKAGDARALVLVADARSAGAGASPSMPGGGRPLAECVRARRPDLEDVLARLLSGVVLVESGWRAALDAALARPDLVVVT